jgi:hypothetical protein
MRKGLSEIWIIPSGEGRDGSADTGAGVNRLANAFHASRHRLAG